MSEEFYVLVFDWVTNAWRPQALSVSPETMSSPWLEICRDTYRLIGDEGLYITSDFTESAITFLTAFDEFVSSYVVHHPVKSRFDVLNDPLPAWTAYRYETNDRDASAGWRDWYTIGDQLH